MISILDHYMATPLNLLVVNTNSPCCAALRQKLSPHCTPTAQ